MVSDIITGLTYQHDFLFFLAFWFCFIGWERFMLKAIEMLIVKQLEMLQKIQKLLACFKLLI